MRSPEGERQRQGGRTRSPQNRQGKQILRQEIAHQYDKGKEGVYLPAPHGEGVPGERTVTHHEQQRRGQPQVWSLPE